MTSHAMAATVHRTWAADLEPCILYELLRLRVEVFVVEQACLYPELDGRDLEDRTRHYWLDGNGNPKPVLGCVRLLEEPNGDYHVGRLCTARSARGQGRGRQLMEAVLGEVGDRTCMLHAQAHVSDFYRRYGFTPTGPSYDWYGVAHLPMRRTRR